MTNLNRHAQVALDSCGQAVAYALECPEKRQYCHDSMKVGEPTTCSHFSGFEMNREEAWVICSNTNLTKLEEF